MKSYIVYRISYIVLAILIAASYSHAETTSSQNLIENAKEFDGKRIDYRGEAVAAVMNRGEYSWVNVHDGTNAIGVYTKSGLAGKIMVFGNYKYKGDIVEVSGVFNRACAVHNGELDIHADDLKIVASGYKVMEKVAARKIIISTGLFAATFLVIIAFRKRV